MTIDTDPPVDADQLAGAAPVSFVVFSDYL